MKTAAAPFPFTSMFQNGPRRQGSAPQNRFKPGKDFPPPRTYRAPLPAPGRSEDSPDRRERGQMQSKNHSPFVGRLRPPFGRNRVDEIIADAAPKSVNPWTAS